MWLVILGLQPIVDIHDALRSPSHQSLRAQEQLVCPPRLRRKRQGEHEFLEVSVWWDCSCLTGRLGEKQEEELEAGSMGNGGDELGNQGWGL